MIFICMSIMSLFLFIKIYRIAYKNRVNIEVNQCNFLKLDTDFRILANDLEDLNLKLKSLSNSVKEIKNEISFLKKEKEKDKDKGKEKIVRLKTVKKK